VYKAPDNICSGSSPDHHAPPSPHPQNVLRTAFLAGHIEHGSNK